ncbi:MAG: hypothetical protein JW892_04345 [Anaerolineae bacterium]|nr:hypothetical protein [Anaerolineae bacterium]
MTEEFNFENVISHYGLNPQLQRQPAHGKTRRWISSLIGTGAAWEYVAQEKETLLLQVPKLARGRAESIDFRAAYLDFKYKPNGEFVPEQRIRLAGDEFLDLGVFFVDAPARGLALFAAGEYEGIHLQAPFLGREAEGPIVIEFIEAVRYVSLTLLPTTPYVLQVFRETEENVNTYRDMRTFAEFRADRADIQRIAFGHGLPWVAIEELYFER